MEDFTAPDQPVFLQFLHTPVAELERYGLGLRAIRGIEKSWGIYICQIQYASEEDLILHTQNFGKKTLKQLKSSLRLLLYDLERKNAEFRASRGENREITE